MPLRWLSWASSQRGILRVAHLLTWCLASPRSERSKSSGGRYKPSYQLILEVIWCHILLIKVAVDQPRFKSMKEEPPVHKGGMVDIYRGKELTTAILEKRYITTFCDSPFPLQYFFCTLKVKDLQNHLYLKT